MQPPDRAPFAQLITEVLAYYRQDASRFVLDLWWNACQPFDLEQVRAALQRHCTDPERGQYAPKVADLARILQGTSTDRAALAWGKVHEAMSAVGAYQDVVFDDPAIHAVIEDLGGWPKVCRLPLDELGYLQHRFCESHRAYTGRGQFEYPRRLMGDRSPDHEYRAKGIPLPKPALIGDTQRAKSVFAQGTLAGKAGITYQTLEALESAGRPLLPTAQEAHAA